MVRVTKDDIYEILEKDRSIWMTSFEIRDALRKAKDVPPRSYSGSTLDFIKELFRDVNFGSVLVRLSFMEEDGGIESRVRECPENCEFDPNNKDIKTGYGFPEYRIVSGGRRRRVEKETSDSVIDPNLGHAY